MDGACGTHEERRSSYRVLVVKPEGKSYLKDLGMDEGIILKYILKKWDGGKDWIDLTQDRDRCRAVVNTVMNLQFP
jgi:hypothetical protein